MAARIGLAISAVLLALAAMACNYLYLAPLWRIDHFTSNGWNPFAIGLALGLSGGMGFLLPNESRSPGRTVVAIVYAFVYVPTVAITASQAGWRAHVFLLLVLSLTFAMACLVTKRTGQIRFDVTTIPAGLILAILIGWIACTLVLVFEYWHVMSFVGLKDTYTQRAIGRADTLWMAYVQTNYLNLLCPAMLAAGLTHRKYAWHSILGVVGLVILYMITAQKIALVLPLVMCAAAVVFRIRMLQGLAVKLAALSLAIVLAIIVFRLSGNNMFPELLLHRTIGIPAMTLSLYYDLFSNIGYTFWTHVRGVSAVIAIPTTFAADPLWPNLGLIVGERALHNPGDNLNANFFASDGAAAAGLIGIVIIGFVFCAWIAALDYVSSGVNRTFAILVAIPVAVTLTNGPLFTTLLSFGGLFWVAAFGLTRLLSGMRRLGRAATETSQYNGSSVSREGD